MAEMSIEEVVVDDEDDEDEKLVSFLDEAVDVEAFVEDDVEVVEVEDDDDEVEDDDDEVEDDDDDVETRSVTRVVLAALDNGRLELFEVVAVVVVEDVVLEAMVVFTEFSFSSSSAGV
jgi:hypothetical protein